VTHKPQSKTLSIVCPKCGAPSGKLCINADGTRVVHRVRVRAAMNLERLA